MPTPNPTLRREFKGAAAATVLQNAMTSSDISFLLVAANNWPTGAVGKFIITINRGQPDEEKILCDSQTTRTVACLLANRGFDGTTAQGHAAGATVECTLSAFDADEWNQHTTASTGVHGVATVAGLTETQTFTNKTLTGATLDATSTIGGVSGATLAADRAAWTAYTGAAGTNTTVSVARYRLVGKTLFFRIEGTYTGGTSVSQASALNIPAGMLPQDSSQSVPMVFVNPGVNGAMGYAMPTNNFTSHLDIFNGNGNSFATNASFVVQGTIEIQ